MPSMTNEQIDAAPDPETLTRKSAMPPPNNHPIDAARDAAALVRRLIDAGERVPPRLRDPNA